MFKTILFTIPKLVFAMFCYLITGALSLVSGYFTFVFYTTGLIDNDFLAMGFMAISMELIKLSMSAAYPFIRNEQAKRKVLRIIQITVFLSVLASLNFQLMGKDFTTSPASKTMVMLYENLPFLAIVPLKFSQFFATISLSVLIEFFIGFLPTIAPVLLRPDKNYVDINKISILTKVMTILSYRPLTAIDRLYNNTIGQIAIQPIQNKTGQKFRAKINHKNKEQTITDLEKYRQDKETEQKKLEDTNRKENIEVINDLDKTTEYKESINCLDNNPITSIIDVDKLIENNSDNKQDIENKEPENIVQDKESKPHKIKNLDKKELLIAIYKHKTGNICPSIASLIKHTGLSKDRIRILKNYLSELGILQTANFTTLVMIDKYETALKLLPDGGGYYE